MSRRTVLYILLAVSAIFALISVPITMATLQTPVSNARSTFSSTSLYSPTGLNGSWANNSVTLTWTNAAGGGNGNGIFITGMNNGASSSCPATAASYTTVVGNAAIGATTFTDSSSALVSGATWSYNCYLVQTAYSSTGAAPWAPSFVPTWTSANVLATKAVQMVMLHTNNKCGQNTGTSLTVTLPNAVLAGDLLVAVAKSNATQQVSDNVNGNWTRPTSNGTTGLWYFQNSKAAAAGTLIVKVTGGSNASEDLCADGFNGARSDHVLDVSANQGSGGATPWRSGTTAAAGAQEVVYAGFSSTRNNTTAVAGTTNGAAMTLGGQSTTGTQGAVASEYLLSAVAGAQNSTATPSASSQYQGVQAAFRYRGQAIPKVLIQNTADVVSGTNSVTATLGAASTAGNLLIAVTDNNGVANGGAQQFVTPPPGWVSAVSAINGTNASGAMSIWYYPNNPGGLTSFTFTADPLANFVEVQVSEWQGYSITSPLDQKGSMTAAVGAAQTDTATGATTASGELVITGWAVATVVTTFTPGGAYTSLANDPGNGILSDYQMNVGSGVTASESVSADVDPGGWTGVLATFK